MLHPNEAYNVLEQMLQAAREKDRNTVRALNNSQFEKFIQGLIDTEGYVSESNPDPLWYRYDRCRNNCLYTVGEYPGDFLATAEEIFATIPEP